MHNQDARLQQLFDDTRATLEISSQMMEAIFVRVSQLLREKDAEIACLRQQIALLTPHRLDGTDRGTSSIEFADTRRVDAPDVDALPAGIRATIRSQAPRQ